MKEGSQQKTKTTSSYVGKCEGHGTGAYADLIVKIDMAGLDWYMDADETTNGIEATFTGIALSP